ncbi:MAG: F420-non-reducing hydrogenase large subunit [Archaeoglobaceae archaeon]|nr:F420-non-reducing hydrogenase large subunit [Archaeoglobaceae archaeon]MDK2876670.1 F420-non-reducing hydrogenase large subunit [Archaeoglobaceae archaeon]
MTKEIVIDPITRLEGHGKIIIVLNDKGDCVRAFFQIPELRGFEKFAEGRHAEDMPQITSRICGVCPTAHHMASTKALDDLYKVDPPVAAKKIRELFYNLFMLEDHALHVYILGGPDFIVGPDAPKEERNVVGVIKKVGQEVGLKVIGMRKSIRQMMERIGGKAVHPVFGVPGGISKPLNEEIVKGLKVLGDQAIEFAQFTLKVFKDIVLSNKKYLDLITSEAYTHRTYYMGLVDSKNRVNFYDGMIRVVDPNGKEYAKFDVHEYTEYIAEHVEPWTYMDFPYLRKIGWKGFVDGEQSGIYAVAPLARLNVADGMATPLAQEAYEEMFEMLGKPAHYTLAMHWARVIEMIQAAECIKELANDPDILDQNVRNVPTATPSVGVGVVEAPRGTLIHHYETDERGVIRRANLLVATQHNIGRISLSIDKAARSLIRGGVVNDGLLNMVEMAFRAYDPCNACGTHTLPGSSPVPIFIYNTSGELLRVIH